MLLNFIKDLESYLSARFKLPLAGHPCGGLRVTMLSKNPSSSRRSGSSLVTGSAAKSMAMGGLYAEAHRVLAAVVERDVFMRLEKAQFANPLGRNAAGGQIGDAAARKLDPHVGDVDFFRQNTDAGAARDSLRVSRQ